MVGAVELGIEIRRPCDVGGSNPTVDKIFFFVMFACSVFIAAGITAFK